MVEVFKVADQYTREQVATQIGMPVERRGGAWDTGYDEWNGQAFIFANVGIAGRTGHDYGNRWEGKNLIWSGKTNARRGQPQIDRIISNSIDVHVFWRGTDRSPFTYAGLGTAIAATDGTPVQVTWSFERNDPGAGPALPNTSPTWRRGPPPVSGEAIVVRQSGETHVYLLRLEGPVGAFVDLPPGHSVIKIGMSGNVERRVAELNAGFPPGSKVRWCAVRTHKFDAARAAWELEGQHLEALRKDGRWIGGEFAVVPDGMMEELLS
ncbi:GIY-YIG nuclease family protein [Ensifer sp. BR816]|uniref:GIY-YIG nuclease family protein n=1 Tax=Rhizobium sp. (strain BR816) TaxID=1057002 RepID=UPI00037D25A1|nr:GIY-YIG nuclease family protein [Ensifer sp. BR816]